jgi:hypothetical protein
VNLYQPEVMDTPEAARFMRLWNTVFDLLPVGVDWPAPLAHPTTESWLLRCPATVTQDHSELGVWSHVIQALGLDRSPNQTGGWPTSRVLVVPDMGPEPEWAVTVYLPQAGSAAVEIVALARNITSEASELEEIPGEPVPTYRSRPKNEPTTIPLDTRRRSLSRDVAETVTATLLQAIETAESSIDEIVIHPTTDYFMAWKGGAGRLCALAESPPPDSLGGRLQALAELLAGFARGEAEEHAVLAQLTAVRELLDSVTAPAVPR